MASDEGTQITGDLSRPKVALACVLSEPILVDSRKRTQRERPRAKSSNVRLVHRQPGQAANSGLPLGVPPRASFSTESAHACSIGQTPQAWTLGDINPPAAPPPQHVQLLAGAGGEPILDACPGTRTMGITNDTMATTSQSSAPSSPLPPSQSFTEDKNDFYDGIGDGTVELNNALVITQVFGHTAFGYTPNELTGVSILTILPADDHQLFIQTAKVLLEFNEAPLQDLQVPLSQTLPSVRALHRVIYQCPDDTGAAEEIMDSAISVIRQTRPGEANTLLVSSRCADLLAIGPEGSSGSALFRIL